MNLACRCRQREENAPWNPLSDIKTKNLVLPKELQKGLRNAFTLSCCCTLVQGPSNLTCMFFLLNQSLMFIVYLRRMSFCGCMLGRPRIKAKPWKLFYGSSWQISRIYKKKRVYAALFIGVWSAVLNSPKNSFCHGIKLIMLLPTGSK